MPPVGQELRFFTDGLTFKTVGSEHPAMPAIKRKTIGGKTYALNRYPTEKRGKEYEYYVTQDGKRLGKTVYTKKEAMQRWREVVEFNEKAANDTKQRQGPTIPGFGYEGEGPTLPGTGGATFEMFGFPEKDSPGGPDPDSRWPWM